jgi:hypothetical protein
MSIHYLKFEDTRPILRVSLKNPDGTAYDLTGATTWKLHVLLNDGTVVSRNMVVEGATTLGVVTYTWLAADWDTANVNGFLIAGPSLPLAPGESEHKMEYEIVGPGTVRLTFPNDGYDILRITPDVA